MKGNDIKLGMAHKFIFPHGDKPVMIGKAVDRRNGKCCLEILPTVKVWVPNRNVLSKVRA